MVTEQETGKPDTRIEAFLAVLQQETNDADCRLCLSQLHDYVVAQQAGDNYRTQFAWTAQHLDGCVTCAEAYSLMFDMILADSRDGLAQQEHIPAPDLSFLTTVPNLATALNQAIRQTARRFTLQLNDALAGLLAPAPQAALTRSAGEDRYGQKLLELKPEQVPEATLPLTLTAYADREQPGRCLVEVTVEPAGMSWPDLGGQVVTVTTAEQSLFAETDEWGTAVFPDILILDLDTLRLDVSLGDALQ